MNCGLTRQCAMANVLVEKVPISVDWVQLVVKDEQAVSVAKLIVQDCLCCRISLAFKVQKNSFQIVFIEVL